MFEDILGEPEKKTKGFLNKDSQEIHDKCTSCEHSSELLSVGPGAPSWYCAIAAGMECAHNKEEPFKRWKSK